MSEPLQLSVVDQAPVREGGTAADALNETVALAVATEKLGYARYWVAEHHNLANFASTSPEILIGQIAARTHRIRVGSGGVMLTHYSAFKVAENFRLLDALYPGRIDLGIGRAPGSDQLTALALSYPSQPRDVRHFPEQVRDVVAYLSDNMDANHPFAQVHAGPGVCSSMPEVWLLGSRYESAYMAAQFGLPFSYAHFFSIAVEEGPAIVESYRRRFQPSAYLSAPKVNVTVHVLCAETEAQAKRLALSRNLARLRTVRGLRAGIPPVTTAELYPYTEDERAYLQHLSASYIDGNPQQVKAGLDAISARYQTHDIGVVTICYNFADRLRSYELVADVCEMKGQETTPTDIP